MGLLKKLRDKVTAPDVGVDLRLDKYSVGLGENLTGSLNLSIKEDFDATEVRCEIACTEQARVISYQYDPTIKRNVPREVTETHVLFSAKPVLGSATHFITGDTKNFKLNFNVPAGARPTLQGSRESVAWTIKGVVAVDGRPDAVSRMSEIQVLQPTVQVAAPSAPTTQTVVKEVVREVVKIPCKYCNTLFDQLDTSCPNCGAKRTG